MLVGVYGAFCIAAILYGMGRDKNVFTLFALTLFTTPLGCYLWVQWKDEKGRGEFMRNVERTLEQDKQPSQQSALIRRIYPPTGIDSPSN